MPLPADFNWGVSTSAYQIEGGRTDGKGDSIWDTFSDSGRLADRGDVTCDHYHRWEEDVALMARLGIDSYRFSLAWSRLLPDGTGQVNQKGLDFYERLIDSLLDHGITPWVTLFHWDLPQALQDRGGWPLRATAEAFAEYAGVAGKAFGDRVTNWITHNEPWVAMVLGHVDGIFAPGLRDWNLALPAGHHILVSHGWAVESLRSTSPGCSVGIALDCRPSYPATDEDLAAERHFDGYRNRWFFDPIFGKGYPADIVATYEERGRHTNLGFVRNGDLATIATPIEFLGLNYYTSIAIAAGGEESEDTGVPPGPNPPGGYTEMGWAITPDALTGFLGRVEQEYSPAAIVITENGASYSDAPGPDGVVRDSRRIEYLKSHIEAVGEAVSAGIPVTGYFVWSLLDNLEWVAGYSQRFGLIHVDHATGTRTPKESFDWYRRHIHQNRG